MNIRSLVSLFFTIAVLAIAVTTSASGVTKRIKFARGKHSATVSGAVVRADRDTYIVGSGKGQTMKVKITSIEDNAVFQVKGPDGKYLPNAGNGDDAVEITEVLPNGGDYRIVVGGTRGNASYRLWVEVK